MGQSGAGDLCHSEIQLLQRSKFSNLRQAIIIDRSFPQTKLHQILEMVELSKAFSADSRVLKLQLPQPGQAPQVRQIRIRDLRVLQAKALQIVRLKGGEWGEIDGIGIPRGDFQSKLFISNDRYFSRGGADFFPSVIGAVVPVPLKESSEGKIGWKSDRPLFERKKERQTLLENS